MQIRFTTSICGAGWSHSHGDTVDLSDGEAARLIVAGVAAPVSTEPPAETATERQGVVERAVAMSPPPAKRSAAHPKTVAA